MRNEVKAGASIGYIGHAVANWAVCCRCVQCIVRQAILLVFHFAHGLIPVRFTSHEFWKI